MKKLIVSIILLILIAFIGTGVYIFYQNYQAARSKAIAKRVAAQHQAYNVQATPQNTEAVHEVAVNFFQACSAGDWDKAKNYCPYADRLKASQELDGLQVIHIGEPYKKNPQYAGLHVPYEIKLKSGETKKYDLAIRNDNASRTWQVDGGI